MRTALAFDLRNIVILKKYSPEENAYLASIASGALEKINIFRVSNLNNILNLLKKNSWWIIGLESKEFANCKDIQEHNTNYQKKVIVLGSEREGIRKLVRESCDILLRIPINSTMSESLNVGVAAGIAIYELNKSSFIK